MIFVFSWPAQLDCFPFQKLTNVTTPDKKASQKIGLRLRNLLKLPKAHKWCIYEWFYSNIDRYVLQTLYLQSLYAVFVLLIFTSICFNQFEYWKLIEVSAFHKYDCISVISRLLILIDPVNGPKWSACLINKSVYCPLFQNHLII